MGKQDNIYEKGNLSGLPFSFNEEVAEVFEDMIERSVPGYKTSQSIITLYAKNFYREYTNCYDIGCSLGASSFSILQGANRAKIIAIDKSAAMIDKCERIFKNYENPNSLIFLNEDIMESDLQNASVVVVNYLIQFLGLDERDILFKKIFNALIPNGILILSEKVHYENKFENQRIINTHHLFKSANGYSELEISGKRDSLEGILKTEYEEDHILRARKVGFTKVEKILSNLNFRTFVFSK